MTEFLGHRADAAEAANDGSSAHEPDVRIMCTHVNVECVRSVADYRRMTTTGETLIKLRARSGLSLEEVALAAGYSGRSGVQRYFSAEFERRLDVDVATRIAAALDGRGTPPIVREEVLTLAGVAHGVEVIPANVVAPKYMDLPRDVPVYGTALGTFVDGEEGEVIEQTLVHQADAIDFFMRPPGYAMKKGLYGVFIAGSSQSPRFEEGEIAFVDPNRPPMVGDDVVVYLVDDDGNGGDKLVAVLIKRLLRRTASHVELRQFNPPLEFRVPAQRISAIHRVLTNAEMLAAH